VAGNGERAVASTYTQVAGQPFATAFHRFAVSVVTDGEDEIEPARGPERAALAPLSVRYLRVAVPRIGQSRLSVRFNRPAAATLVYRIESDIAGEPARSRQVAPRVTDGGRTLEFTVVAGPRRSAVLVLSNGANRATRYAASARRRATT